MGYVIYHAPLGGYIEKQDGMNAGRKNARFATWYATYEEARRARPGHDRRDGGGGYVGTVMSEAEVMARGDIDPDGYWIEPV